jgi:hypothetical protein
MPPLLRIPYCTAFHTGPAGALSAPAFVYDATVKYHVPAASPSIRALVVAAFGTSRLCVSVPAEIPYRIR